MKACRGFASFFIHSLPRNLTSVASSRLVAEHARDIIYEAIVAAGLLVDIKDDGKAILKSCFDLEFSQALSNCLTS